RARRIAHPGGLGTGREAPALGSTRQSRAAQKIAVPSLALLIREWQITGVFLDRRIGLPFQNAGYLLVRFLDAVAFEVGRRQTHTCVHDVAATRTLRESLDCLITLACQVDH